MMQSWDSFFHRSRRVIVIVAFSFIVFLCSSTLLAQHDHTSYHGGQVGMSGDYHVEFVAKEGGEYLFFISDIKRKPLNISKATGTLTINPDDPNPEQLTLAVDPHNEFLVGKGKPRPKGESIMASLKAEIPGQESIFVEFLETIGNSV